MQQLSCSGPQNHTKAVSAASSTTQGTKTVAAASAKRCAGAVLAEAAAFSTSWTICATALPLPTRVARTRHGLEPTWRLQPMTVSWQGEAAR